MPERIVYHIAVVALKVLLIPIGVLMIGFCACMALTQDAFNTSTGDFTGKERAAVARLLWAWFGPWKHPKEARDE